MVRIILRHGYAVTAVVLLILAWVIWQRYARGADIVLLLAVAVVVWLIGAFVFVYFWPQITVGGFKRAILNRGLGGGPIPLNTLYAVSDSSSGSAPRGSLIATGTDDVVYVAGWLDVRAGPLQLHVPAMSGRYYCVQFTDLRTGANFAYVGKRTTGTDEGSFVVCERGWAGSVPGGMRRIDVPHGSALVIGRVFAADDDDRQIAYTLARQIAIKPLDNRTQQTTTKSAG